MSEEKLQKQGRHQGATDLSVVVVGGSAGSLEPLRTFFATVGPETGAAFIVVTHQSADRNSVLGEILAGVTSMEVTVARQGVELQPNHVFVCEAGESLRIEKGVLQVSHGNRQLPLATIDTCLKSLAEQAGPRAIAVILSGMRSDGALGASAVKNAGGIVLAQSPGSCEFQSMPKAAIETGSVDHVMPVDDLADQVALYLSRNQSSHVPGQAMPLLIDAGDTPSLNSLFDLLFQKTGCDFSLYKSGTVFRRLARRMTVNDKSSLNEYLGYIRKNPTELDNLFRELLIDVTSFFRDEGTFRALIKDVLPGIIHGKKRGEAIRVWVPACSTGEEAYSIAIAIKDCLETIGANVPAIIFATDLNDYAIEFARRAMYPEGISQNVGKERLQKYFVHKGDYFQINGGIREQVIFAKQNLLNDPPFTRLDIVSCRNFMIYLNAEAQQRLIRQFHFALNPGGILVLGASESVSNQDRLFNTVDSKNKIFKRKDAVASYEAMSQFGAVGASPAKQELTHTDQLLYHRPFRVDRLVSEILLNRHAPPSVLVNWTGQFLFLHGRTGEFLEPPEGQPNMTLFDMARSGLELVLPQLFDKAEENPQTCVYDEASVSINGEYKNVQVSVTTFDEPEAFQGLFLVSFQLQESLPQADAGNENIVPDETQKSVAKLRMELTKTKESLQLAIQQKNWAMQDLQASNEELQATNEELQSTNEELETSREELQSMNEELTTINAELERHVTQLYNANDDMQNLLNSIEVATIFLDNNLNVKRFNNQVHKLISLREADVGRPLAEIKTKIAFNDLIDEVEQVLATLVPFESEVKSLDGQFYLLRIQAYRTAKNVINGVVITFVNISKIRQLEGERGNAVFCSSLMGSVQQPLLVVDLDCRVVEYNEGFVDLFGKPAEPQALVHELNNGAWNDQGFISALQECIVEAHPQDGVSFNVNMSCGSMPVTANIRRIAIADCEDPRILIAINATQDIHAIKVKQNE